MNYYYCDTCHYCFSADKFPDRCPDCGAIEYNDHAAVRQATDTEVKELLRIRAEDNDRKENTQNESTSTQAARN